MKYSIYSSLPTVYTPGSLGKARLPQEEDSSKDGYFCVSFLAF